MTNTYIFDIETQYAFDEVGGPQNLHLLKVSLVGAYSYKDQSFLTFEEKELKALEEIFLKADKLIGFNSKYFDIAVLQPYFSFDLKKIPHTDIMEDITNFVGHRVSLNSVAGATLGGIQKSGFGLDAIKYFREGNIEALKKYCLDDVKITRDIYEYGKQNGKVFFESKFNNAKIEVPVKWEDVKIKKSEENSQRSLF